LEGGLAKGKPPCPGLKKSNSVEFGACARSGTGEKCATAALRSTTGLLGEKRCAFAVSDAANASSLAPGETLRELATELCGERAARS
jgi:hypothetical protein